MTQEEFDELEEYNGETIDTSKIKKPKKRFRAKDNLMLLTDEDRFKRIEQPDGSVMVCETGVGVVAIWSKEYLAIFMPLLADHLEGAREKFRAKKLERSAKMPVFNFGDVVVLLDGNTGVFMGHEDEYRLTSIINVTGWDDVAVYPTDELAKIPE